MRLAKANTKAIKYACMNFHYAKSIPTVQYAYNVYNDNNEWCGVIVYGVGANPLIAKQYGLNNGEILELERVALNGKQEITSKAVALSLKLLHKDNPLVKMIISYADTRQGHYGTIYQATNWYFLGLKKIGGKEYYVKGKWVHRRSLGHFTEKERKIIKQKCESRISSNKYKYIYIYDKKLKKKIENELQEYPKKS